MRQWRGIGIIEGFFGRPWSWEVRRASAELLQGLGFRFCIYAPKADPYLRQRWAEPWPKDMLDALRGVREAYRRAGVAWGIGLNLYEAHCSFDGQASRRLEQKVSIVNGLDPDILAILFDDMRGDRRDLARVQADICHRARAAGTAQWMIMCPTYYSDSPSLDRLFGDRPPDYLERLGRALDPSIGVFWTGPEVCSAEYPIAHFHDIAGRLGREPVLWDNYPVNDSRAMCRFLHLRAVTGRSHRLAEATAAHAANPMNQAHLSMIPLATLAASYRDRDRYEPEAAWLEAARTLLGERLADALRDDLALFQDGGLDAIDRDAKSALIAKYVAFANPYADEIVAWLRGAYPYSPDCPTE